MALSSNSEIPVAPPRAASPCRACGACCSFARDWPRFSTEDESDLARIPSTLVAADLAGMRCDGNRCSALVGKVGVATSCTVYDIRPVVCRACEPGSEACGMARHRFGLSALAA
ncbi:MAG TPA: YkgJ family cysteine cluster protein [Dongiaceae bacterium]|nr:YkgJ family cysteine cluster protein [Dongiaceae bacterium]